MGKFKVGDRVECLDSYADQFTKGKIYIVSADHLGNKYESVKVERDDGGSTENGWLPEFFKLAPAITIEPGKHYRLRNGKVTGRISQGDIGFEALVDGQVKVFDKAGGHVFGDGEFDIVEAWVPKVGERVVNNENTRVDIVRHWNQHFRAGNGSIIDGALVVASVADRVTSNIGLSNKVGRSFFFMPADTLQPAAPAQPAVLRIQQGKFYKTRDGRKVGPLGPNDGGLADYPLQDNSDWTECWTTDGRYYNDGTESQHDLIAEWIDEPVTEAPTASNDNAAPAKFKVGDTVRILSSDWPDVIKVGEILTLGRVGDDGVYPLAKTGEDYLYYYFNEVELATPTAHAIVALIEDGVAKPATKPKVHTSQADATAEAERLALAHPGQQFGVFVLADSKIADVVNVPTPVLRAA